MGMFLATVEILVSGVEEREEVDEAVRKLFAEQTVSSIVDWGYPGAGDPHICPWERFQGGIIKAKGEGGETVSGP